jgi:hypothetical protein
MALIDDSSFQSRNFRSNWVTKISVLIHIFGVVAADWHTHTANSGKCRVSFNVQRNPSSLLLTRSKLSRNFIQRLRGGHGKECGCGESGDVSNRLGSHRATFMVCQLSV